MRILQWMIENWELVALVVFGAILLAMEGWERTKALAYRLMLEAEKLMAQELLSGGPEKMEYVVAGLHDLLPAQVKGVIRTIAAFRGQTSEEFLRDLAQWLYDRMKEAIEA